MHFSRFDFSCGSISVVLFVLFSLAFGSKTVADPNWIQHKDWFHASFPNEQAAEAYTSATNAENLFVTIRLFKEDQCYAALFLEKGDGIALSQRQLEVVVDDSSFTYPQNEAGSLFEFADISGLLLEKIKQGKSFIIHQDGMTFRFGLSGSAQAVSAIQLACEAFTKANRDVEFESDAHSDPDLIGTAGFRNQFGDALDSVPKSNDGLNEREVFFSSKNWGGMFTALVLTALLLSAFVYLGNRLFERDSFHRKQAKKSAEELDMARREAAARESERSSEEDQLRQARAAEERREQVEANRLKEQERAREEQQQIARERAEQERHKLAEARRQEQEAEALRAAEERAREIQRQESERQRLLEEKRRAEAAREAKEQAAQAVASSLNLLGLEGRASVEQVYEVFSEKKHIFNPERVKVFGPTMQAAAEARLRELEEAIAVLRRHGRA